MRETSKKVLFWALMFFGAFLLLTQVGYSDGDDAFFYQYTHEMGFTIRKNQIPSENAMYTIASPDILPTHV